MSFGVCLCVHLERWIIQVTKYNDKNKKIIKLWMALGGIVNSVSISALACVVGPTALNVHVSYESKVKRSWKERERDRLRSIPFVLIFFVVYRNFNCSNVADVFVRRLFLLIQCFFLFYFFFECIRNKTKSNCIRVGV